MHMRVTPLSATRRATDEEMRGTANLAYRR